MLLFGADCAPLFCADSRSCTLFAARASAGKPFDANVPRDFGDGGRAMR